MKTKETIACIDNILKNIEKLKTIAIGGNDKWIEIEEYVGKDNLRHFVRQMIRYKSSCMNDDI